jgi:alkaline phosphatase
MSAIIKFIIPTLLSVTTLLCFAEPKPDDVNESTQKNVWWQAGKSTLQQRLLVKPNYNQAKNVILFIGDGMGVSTVTAARIFDGQSRGHSGEENVLSFEHFPNIALIKTYSVDAQVADSASTL